MIKDIETLGLKVESIRPSTNKHDVGTDTDIKIKFNAEILVNTVINNILVYEDTNALFNGEIEEKDLTRINGKVSYDNKTVIFTPNNELDQNKQYIIVVRKNGVKDVLGRSLLFDNISTFFTKSNKALTKPLIISPKFGDTVSASLMIEFTDIYDIYNVQISKNIEFDSFIINEVVNSSNNKTVKYSPDVLLEDGLYFLRIKTDKEVFSDVVQFVIQENIGVVSEEDYNELLQEFNYTNNHILKASYPEQDKMCNVALNKACLSFEGELSILNINLNKSYMEGVLFDETDSDSIEEHGEIDTNIITVYDKEENTTYVVCEILE